jgi:predicted nucleotidyltransferase component of viral defense system
MTFHHSSEFQNAIEAAALYHKLQPAFIEKDYWVTYVLKNIALSDYQNLIVFKGGTSLSKAYQCIERFSEDVDLALLKTGEETNSKLKRLLENVEAVSTQGLTYQKDTKESKGGHLRKTYWQYPKINSDETGTTGDNILIEINCFTTPVPHKPLVISSYVGDFLTSQGFADLVNSHDLYPFNMQVLSLERTFFEKLLSLTRLSYEGNDKLKEKIRHFYDLHQLFHLPELGDNLFEAKQLALIKQIQKDDKSNPIFRGAWEDKALSDAPIIAQFEKIWKTLIPTYENEMPKLLWGKLPPPSAIELLFQRITELLIENDL